MRKSARGTNPSRQSPKPSKPVEAPEPVASKPVEVPEPVKKKPPFPKAQPAVPVAKPRRGLWPTQAALEE